jgi:hypothetical protein
MIVEWLFPIHVDKMPPLLQRTALALADTPNFHATATSGLFFAVQR